VRLIALKKKRRGWEVWTAEPLFVAPQCEIEVTIRVGEDLRPLHTQYTRTPLAMAA
jgi:hypothetical protein